MHRDRYLSRLAVQAKHVLCVAVDASLQLMQPRYVPQMNG